MKSPKFIGTPAERAKQIKGLWQRLAEMIDDLPPAEREATYEHIRSDIDGHVPTVIQES